MRAGGALVLAALLMLAGCGPTRLLDRAYAGRSVTYAPGALAFDVEAEADSAGIDVWVALPPVSLTFEQEGARFAARYHLDVQLLDEASEGQVAGAATTDTLRLDAPEKTRSFDPHVARLRLKAPPGLYRLVVVLRDEHAQRTARQQIRVRVPAAGAFAMGPIHLQVRFPGDALRPLLALHVPARFDTLRAALALSGLDPGMEAAVTLCVVRFETDTLGAEVPYGYTGLGSLAYRGVRFERADTVLTARQTLAGSSRRVAASFDLPLLVPGLYRLIAQAQHASQTFRQERLLAVKPYGFPHVATMGEMVEALGYLLDRREQRRFAAADPEEQRVLFDRFWGRAVRNRDAAAGRLRRYLDRVEEANLRFSGYKAGWKTDRGMVYVVLGPPLHAETWPDREVWYYSYDESDERYTYLFERVRGYDAETPFEQFVLVRSGAFHQPWERAVEGWRTGER